MYIAKINFIHSGSVGTAGKEYKGKDPELLCQKGFVYKKAEPQKPAEEKKPEAKKA